MKDSLVHCAINTRLFFTVLFSVETRSLSLSFFFSSIFCLFVSSRIPFVPAKNPREHMFKCVGTALVGARVLRLVPGL